MSDLESAAVLSLLSQRRYGDQSGYWVEALTNESFGSYLWLLNRSRLNDETRRLSAEYAHEALGWMLSAGLITDLKIDAEIRDSRIIIHVRLDTEDGEKKLTHVV